MLAVRHPDRGLGRREEAGERRGGAALGQDAGHQVPPPVVAVVAVRRALGVDLANRPVAVEHPGVHQVHEGQHVAAAVRVAQAARPREALGDALEQRVGLGALVGDRHEEVEGDAGAGEAVGDLVPEVVVEDMRHHREVGRRRGGAAEPRHRPGEARPGLRQLLDHPELAMADLDVVQEGRDAGLADVGVVAQVDRAGEVRVRLQVLALADRHVVPDGHAAEDPAHVRMVGGVEVRVEQAARPDLADIGALPAARQQEPRKLLGLDDQSRSSTHVRLWRLPEGPRNTPFPPGIWPDLPAEHKARWGRDPAGLRQHPARPPRAVMSPAPAPAAPGASSRGGGARRGCAAAR